MLSTSKLVGKGVLFLRGKLPGGSRAVYRENLRVLPRLEGAMRRHAGKVG
jgi:hypothetical protein